jgi:hypothetical protein
MKNFIYLLLVIAMMLLGAPVQAQQPSKIPRIGFLTVSSASLSRPASTHSARVYASLETWKGKTLSLSGDLLKENPIVFQRSRRS